MHVILHSANAVSSCEIHDAFGWRCYGRRMLPSIREAPAALCWTAPAGWSALSTATYTRKKQVHALDTEHL